MLVVNEPIYFEESFISGPLFFSSGHYNLNIRTCLLVMLFEGWKSA